jgi:hypothetical protein
VVPLAPVLEPFGVVAVQLAGRFGGLHPQPLELPTWTCEVVAGLVVLALTLRSSVHRTPGIRGT